MEKVFKQTDMFPYTMEKAKQMLGQVFFPVSSAMKEEMPKQSPSVQCRECGEHYDESKSNAVACEDFCSVRCEVIYDVNRLEYLQGENKNWKGER